MNASKRTLSLILAAMLLASCTASCGSEAAPKEDTAGTTTQPTVETEPNNGRQNVADSLPNDLDFGGKTLRIYTRGGDAEVMGEIDAESGTGEVVSDAVYARNLAVKERLNIDMEITYSESNRHQGDHAYLRTLILSGADEFDLIGNSFSYMGLLAVEGMFQNLQSMPYLDFDQPWWNHGYMETAAYEGRNYLCLGEVSLTMISGVFAMFFNKNMFEEFYQNEPSLYETVLDGKWTLDKMLSYCAGFYSDLNGNTIADEGDRFGNYYRDKKMLGSDAYLGGCGIELVTLDESGEVVYNGLGERMTSFMEKMTKLIFEDDNTFRGSYNDDTVMVPLSNGWVLFTPWMLGATSQLRDMKDDFGIIPMPKLDENQASYSATVHNGSTVFGIPVTCQETDLPAAALEALCAESYRVVTPAYFEVALKAKYSRDEESSQMLDLIVNSVFPDLTHIYGQKLGHPVDMVRGFFASPDDNRSALATLAGRESGIKSMMESVLTELSKLDH